MLAPNLNEIGGGVVRRRFRFGERELLRGEQLTADEIRSLPATNRQALINNNYIELYRAAPAEEPKRRRSKGD